MIFRTVRERDMVVCRSLRSIQSQALEILTSRLADVSDRAESIAQIAGALQKDMRCRRFDR